MLTQRRIVRPVADIVIITCCGYRRAGTVLHGVTLHAVGLSVGMLVFRKRIIHCVPTQKGSHWIFDNNFGKCGPIFKILYQLIREKILYVYMQRLPPHLRYVATLPCESRKSKNVNNFYSILNKLLTCS